MPVQVNGLTARAGVRREARCEASPARGGILRGYGRRARAARARSASAGRAPAKVGTLFARDRTTAAHACSVVEDRRDDPDLDGRLGHLERAVASLIDALFSRRG
jgi:hypothetical protein